MAYFIIETEEQFSKLTPEENAYVEVIVGNNNYHPKLTSPIAIYYRTSDKGYIIPINHSETFNLDFELIKNFLSSHKSLYAYDRKFTSYFLETGLIWDIGTLIMNKENKLPELDIDTQIQKEFYRKHYQKPDINRLIPIVKLYERSENLYNQVKGYIGDTYTYEQDLVINVYKAVEEQGLTIDEKIFNKYFEPHSSVFSMKDGKIYTSYNVHNLTSRPTNAFNNINFLAINKDDKSRSAFIPGNTMLIELDFEAYHLKLIANLVGEYTDSTESIHKLLAREYFQKEDITDEEYKEAKELSFKLIYGGIPEDYLHIPFFQKIVKMQGNLWEEYKIKRGILLPTERWLKMSDNMYSQKLFNYYIQNLETSSNIQILKEITNLLKNYRSKVVLVVYDSLLIDFNTEDGKEPIIKIKQIIENQHLSAKFKYGKDYNSLQKTDYL
jgi:hypothetical protein